MAFSNTYDTTNPGSAVSNREDLTNILAILEPESTPVISLAKKTKAEATTHSWTVDNLAAPDGAGIDEGADVSTFVNKFSGRAKLSNQVQKFRRAYQVSDTQQAVRSVGPADYAQAKIKALKEIKRDQEFRICSASDKTVEDGAGTPNAMRGLGDWIDSAGPSDVPSAYRTPAASIKEDASTMTEAEFNALITSMYRETGEVNKTTLVADTALRRVITDYTRATAATYQVNEKATGKKITNAVNTYDSDFGLISIVSGNPVCMPQSSEQDTGYFINESLIGLATLVPLGSTDLEDQGGGPRGYVDCHTTLEVYNPLGFGKITDLTA
jgi:hypothetical protein